MTPPALHLPRRRSAAGITALLLLLLAVAVVAAIAQALGTLPNVPVDLVVEGERIFEGFNFGRLDSAQRWWAALWIVVALITLLVVIPVTLLIVLLLVLLSVALALGAAGVAVVIAASPVLILVLPVIWLWRRSARRRDAAQAAPAARP